MKRISILGAGSWGIALASHCRRLGHSVTLWGRDEKTLSEVATTGQAERFFGPLPGVKGIATTTDLPLALEKAEFVIVALPSRAVPEVLVSSAPYISERAILISATKGLEEGSGRRISELFQQIVPGRALAVLTGPSFAIEVFKNLPTALVIASEVEQVRKEIVQNLHGDRFRIYETPDVIGAELGGTLKNVLAIAAGIVDGAELGVNARAALITRGLVEMRRLIVAAGGSAETVSGLSGLGDLLLTATSDYSRNRRVGLALGKGEKLESVLGQISQVAEGVECSSEIVRLGQQYAVELPIASEVNELLLGKKNLQESVSALFSRVPRAE